MTNRTLAAACWLAASATLLSAQTPPPHQTLGFRVGADRQLADWGQISAYFQKLDAASERVLVQELGRTTLNNPLLLAVISSPANLRELNRYQEIQRRLADPRRPSGRPEELIRQGKSVVLVTCGIHATEVGASQMAMELAYEMADAKDARTSKILDQVILLLIPSLNPDGLNVVARWLRETVNTPAEGTPPPELYHPYAGHDNNRDWYMFALQETRLVVEKVHQVWHPHIVIDLHQMGANGARLFVPPYVDPIDPNVDPILQAEIVSLGGSIFADLLAAGKQGVVINAMFDAYTPARAYQHYHGGVRILLEAASARLASPREVKPNQLAEGRGYYRSTPTWNHPLPWSGGRWGLRDIVDYHKSAVMAGLIHAAVRREDWLRNFRQVAVNSVDRRSPFAFLLPPGQPDAQALADLLEVLRFGQIEVHRSLEPLRPEKADLVSPPFGDPERKEFPAGTLVVFMQQPFSSFAKTLLERGTYPEFRQYPGGPIHRPYDVTAHNLGTQLGVEVHQAGDPFSARTELVDSSTPAGNVGRLIGTGDVWLFSHSSYCFARLVNRLFGKGASLAWAPNGFEAEGRTFPVGSLMARMPKGFPDKAALLTDLPLEVVAMERFPHLAWQTLRAPRIGLYRSRSPESDEGWTRLVLERNEFPYGSLYDSEIRTADLSPYDVIVFANQRPSVIKKGLSSPYPESSRGGIGPEGLARLDEFVKRGGTLLLLGDSTRLATEELGQGARPSVEPPAQSDFDVPGALLRVTVNNRHPIGFGMPEQAAVMFDGSPTFEVRQGLSVVQYAEREALLSGWARGESLLAGKSGLTEIKRGRGRLILIGFRTQFRAQTRSTYKFLFNALYYAAAARE
jgi:hypothetical protein